jgi:hypothetical protein
MAQYGYSTPYSGQQVAPLPPGYMEAATAPGRNLAMGITAIGQGLGKALERYTENKKAHEAADQTNTAVTQMFLQQMENDPKVQAVRYFEDTGQLPTGVDETTLKSYEAQMKRDAGMISNLVGSSAKWADMSLTKKKTALGDTVTMLNQYRNNQQDDFKNQATRQQLAVGALQLEKAKFDLEDIKAKREQQNILSGAVRYGLDQPTTTTQTEQVTDTINFPPIPGRVTPAVMATPSQAEATAARYYMGKYGQAAKDIQQYGSDLEKQANTLNLDPRYTTKPNDNAYQVFGASYQGLGFPTSLPPTTFVNSEYESPIEAAARVEANIRLKNEELAQSSAALRQAGIMSKSPALQTIGPRTLQTAQEAPPIQLPPLTITQNIPTQVPISYEDQSKRLTQYLVQQGAKPETLAMVPQILSMVGQRMPTRVEPVGNIGSVIRFGDKEQFVPAQQTNISDILKVKGLTVDFPEFRGTAPTEAEAAKFRDQYSSVLESRKAISDLLDIAKMGTAMQQTPEIRTKANSLVSGLRGVERINIIGPGTITPEDFKLLNSVIPDPTAIFSLKKSNIQAFETMLQKSARAIESKAKAIGLETIRAQTQPVTGASSGNFKLVIGKGIQPIQ